MSVGVEGRAPSEASRFPPGKTWADGKAEDVCTLWRRRISLLGEIRMMLAEGDAGAGALWSEYSRTSNLDLG